MRRARRVDSNFVEKLNNEYTALEARAETYAFRQALNAYVTSRRKYPYRTPDYSIFFIIDKEICEAIAKKFGVPKKVVESAIPAARYEQARSRCNSA